MAGSQALAARSDLGAQPGARGSADSEANFGARSGVRSKPPTESKVEVVRSPRRRRTVSAYRDGDRTVVLVPARLTPAEEEQWVARMVAQLDAREARRRPSDDGLLSRARALSARWLAGRAEPETVRWVDNQGARWGSCTPSDRSIRLSRRLQGLPEWVVDYVLVHELVHLLVPGHGPQFWWEVERYPRCERARGFLEGVSAAARLPVGDEEW